MISISRRQQVAFIKGSPIYVITGLALIPLSSQKDAESAILQAQQSLEDSSGGQGPDTLESDDSDDEAKHLHVGLSEDDHHETPIDSKPPISPRTSAKGSSVAEDIIGKRGQYGRFAERWFSRKGWSNERRKAQGMSTESREKTDQNAFPSKSTGAVDVKSSIKQTRPSDPVDSSQVETLNAEQKATAKAVVPSTTDNVTHTLVPKLLRTTKMLLASRSFYFSYDYDISRRIGSQCSRDISMDRAVDPSVRLSSFPLCETAQAHRVGSSSGITIWQRHSLMAPTTNMCCP